MTSTQGVRINDDTNSLKGCERDPSLFEDFLLREKITPFDHERIPERVVYARGSAAHGCVQAYGPIPQLTKAGFLNNPSRKTPVFARFSTVAGSRGSSDLAREGARRVGADPMLIRTWKRSIKILKQAHPEISGNIPYETLPLCTGV